MLYDARCPRVTSSIKQERWVRAANEFEHTILRLSSVGAMVSLQVQKHITVLVMKYDIKISIDAYLKGHLCIISFLWALKRESKLARTLRD